MSITEDANSLPLVTSVYDWETACIVPAILSDPSMAVEVDLVTNEDAAPSFSLGYLTTQHQPTSKITRYGPNNISRCVLVQIYFIFDFGSNFPSLFNRAPDYKLAIQAGKDARYIWFALRDWHGDDPEGYFGRLGNWAEKRMKDLGINGS